MAFVRHEWTTGEIITAEKLNCIESGVDCLANCSNLWTKTPERGTGLPITMQHMY